jgi:hypothetical protein
MPRNLVLLGIILGNGYVSCNTFLQNHFKERRLMFMGRKHFIILAMSVLLILALNNCGKKSEVAEVPKTEVVTLTLTPSVQEVKGEQFTLQLSNLSITETVDKATKELTTTPSLKGNLKIINSSKNILDVQGVTIQYLDSSGNPIAFKTGEKKVAVSTYWSDLRPGKDAENSLDATVPIAAVKEKSLSKIQINVVYIPSPLNRETLEIPVKMEEK